MTIRAAHSIKVALRPVLPHGAHVRRLPLGLGRGLVMEIDFDRDARFWLGLYEVELARYVRELCVRGSSSFDLGSESGYYAIVFARRSGGRALAVEADATTCGRLRRNVQANPSLSQRIDVVEARVAQVTDAATGQVSIDDLAYRDGGFIPDLVKMDVEGSEVAALRGAQRLLAERKPHVIIETHSEDLDAGCQWLFEDHGYEVQTVEPRSWLPEVRTLGFNRWLVARGRPARR